MPRRLFVTGASGFVGRHFLQAARARGHSIAALSRSLPAGEAGDGIDWIQGDLLEPDAWRDALRSDDIVLHLAAATGKANAERHQAINVTGTRALLDAAAHAGAAHFVFVSSIATRFPDQRHYPYAHAKAAAERAVREAGIPWTIIRPTIIVGAGAPVLESFALLAGLPVTPIFGDGQAQVQPIDVHDLVARLLAVIDALPASEVIEFGGPERLALEDWIGRIRAVRSGDAPRLLHLPLAPIRTVLAALEPALLPVLPLTAGQLATFANDGVAAAHPFHDTLSCGFTPLDDSLAGSQLQRLPAVAPDAATLTRECHAFSRHLIGCDAPADVVESYLRHEREHNVGPFSAFEHELLERARRGGLSTTLADAYAARVLRTGLVRRKMTLVLALLETHRETFESIDAPPAASPFGTWWHLITRGLAEVAVTAIALAWLGAAHWRASREAIA